MFKLKVYSHCHDFISNKVNEVKVNFHSPSINRWSVWTRREVLAISQAELILSGSTCHDSPLGNVTECSTSPCPCWGSSDEFLVSDLWPGPPQHRTCPGQKGTARRALGLAATASEHETGSRRNFLARCKSFPPQAAFSHLNPLTSATLSSASFFCYMHAPGLLFHGSAPNCYSKLPS